MFSEKTHKAYKEYLNTLGTSGISYKKGKIKKFVWGGDDEPGVDMGEDEPNIYDYYLDDNNDFKDYYQGDYPENTELNTSGDLGKVTSIFSAALKGYKNAQYDDSIKNKVKKNQRATLDSIYGISDNTGLMSAYENINYLDPVSGKDFGNRSILGDIGSAISTGYNTGKSTKSWQLGLMAGAMDLFGSGARQMMIANDVETLNHNIKVYNQQRREALARQAERVDENNDRLRMLNLYNNNYNAFGGDLHSHGSDFDGNLAFINTGGRHEENPNEGVMVGVDSEGTPNLVEEGEVIWDDYVFSDRLKTPESLKKKYKLGGDLTFAESVKKVLKDAIKRPNDPIVEATNKEILTEFMNAQEEIRLKEQEDARQKFIQSRDEDFMNELAAIQGQQEIMPQDNYGEYEGMNVPEIPQGQEEALPMSYAYGGNIFDKGRRKQTRRSGYIPENRYREFLINPQLPVKLRDMNVPIQADTAVISKSPQIITANPYEEVSTSAYYPLFKSLQSKEGLTSNEVQSFVDRWQKEYNRLLKKYELNSPVFIREAKKLQDNIQKELSTYAESELQKRAQYASEREYKFALMDAEKASEQYLKDLGYKLINGRYGRLSSEDRETYRKIRNGELVYENGTLSKGQKIESPVSTEKRKAENNALLDAITTSSYGYMPNALITSPQQPSNSAEPIEDIATTVEQDTTNVATPYVEHVETLQKEDANINKDEVTKKDKGAIKGRATESANKKGQSTKTARQGVRYGSYKSGDRVTNWNDKARQALEDYLTEKVDAYESTNDEAEKARIRKEVVDTVNNHQSLYKTAYEENEGQPYSKKSAAVTMLQDSFQNKFNGNKNFGTPEDWINAVTKNGIGDNAQNGWVDGYWGNQTALRHFGTLANKDNMGQIAELVDKLGIEGAYDLDYGTQGGKLYTLKEKGAQTTPVSEQAQTTTQTTQNTTTQQPVTTETPQGSGAQTGNTTTYTRPELPMRDESMRYAPVYGAFADAFGRMFGSPDYSNADAIIAAAEELGIPVNIPVDTIGNYRRKRPYDERYMVNLAEANKLAALRSAENTAGGNRAMQLMGASLLARNNQQELGEIMRNAYLANRADDAQVSEFNRGTDLYNMQALNQRNLTQAQLNAHLKQAGFSGLATGYGARQRIKDNWDDALMQSLDSGYTSLGRIGKENADLNILTSMFNEGYYDYAYDPESGGFKFYPREVKENSAKGGKLNRKKRRF